MDSYPRFLRSDLYKQCADAERAGRPLPSFPAPTHTPDALPGLPRLLSDAAESPSKRNSVAFQLVRLGSDSIQSIPTRAPTSTGAAGSIQ